MDSSTGPSPRWPLRAVLPLAVVAGAVQAASHQRIELAFLAPLGAGLLVAAAGASAPKRGALAGALYGLVVGLVFTPQAPGWIAVVVGVGLFVLLAGLLGWVIAVAARRGPVAVLAAGPVVAAVFEGATGGLSPLGDYLGLAASAAGAPGITGLAAYGGLPLVAAAVAGLGAALGVALHGHRWAALVGAGLWLSICAVGHRPVAASSMSVAAVALPDGVRFASGAGAAAELGALTLEAVERGAVLVVWPEAQVRAEVARPGDAAYDAAASAARTAATTIVAGVFDQGADRNLALVFGPDGVERARYAKTHLIPGMEDYVAGDGPSPPVRVRGDVPVGLQICFDDCFGDGVGGLEEAKVLALPTQDWPQVADRHRRLSILRAAQGRLAVVRAAQGGWSQIVGPRGRVIAEARSGAEPVVLVASVPIR